MAYGFPFQTPLKLFFYSRMMSLKKELNKRSPHVISCIFFDECFTCAFKVILLSDSLWAILKDLDSHPVRETKKHGHQFKTEHEDLQCKHSLTLSEVQRDQARYSWLFPLRR